MKLIAYNKIYDYDFIIINNGNKIMLFKYNARFRIKKDLQKEIFLNEKAIKNIDTLNRFLDTWQVTAVCVEKIGNIDYYKIITCDRYLKNQKILEKKNKYNNVSVSYNKRNKEINKDNNTQTSTLDLSDLD